MNSIRGVFIKFSQTGKASPLPAQIIMALIRALLPAVIAVCTAQAVIAEALPSTVNAEAQDSATPVATQPEADRPESKARPDPEQLLPVTPVATRVKKQVETLTEAPNVDLSEPVAPEPVPAKPEPAVADSPQPPDPNQPDAQAAATPEAPPTTVAEAEAAGDFVMLNKVVLPGTTTRLSWKPDQSLQGIATPIPVLIAHGSNPGPVLCLTAAIHGDELNGIEIVREVLYNLDVETLAGTVVGVPIVNLQGFQRGSRYLIDRRDLNRFFPGQEQGSSAARLAHSFFSKVIEHCDALIDLHTASFYRTNLPQLRADLSQPNLLAFTQGFGEMAVLHSAGAEGTLRRAAVDAGVLAVTLEAGEPMRLSKSAVAAGVEGVRDVMNSLGMIKLRRFWGNPQPVYYRSEWVRAEAGGVLFSQVRAGDTVSLGDILGVITDPVTNVQTEILAPIHGRVIGMAIDQVVLPGFAAFHLGAIASKDEVAASSGEANGETPTAVPSADLPEEQQGVASPPGNADESDPEFDYDE